MTWRACVRTVPGQEAQAGQAPDILGMTVVEHADRPGDFTQVVYFSSEQDARRLEQEAPIEAEESAQENHRGLMTDLRSFDLRDPPMLSPADVPTY